MTHSQDADDCASCLLVELQHLLSDYEPIQFGRAVNPVDAFFAYRILLGRLPSRDVELPALFSSASVSATYREFITQLLNSPEYSKHASFLPSGHKLMVELPRFRFWFDSGDREMGATMALGVYEPHVIAALDEFVASGMTCIDAGAQTGFITLHLADRVGPSGQVYAFEPRPQNFQLLEKNIQENNFGSRIQPFAVACSSEEGVLSFREVANMYVASREETGVVHTVQTVLLDNLVRRPVDVVKIDVEGHEPQVLRGMTRILKTDRPVLLTEINKYWLQQARSSVSALSEIFQAHEYAVFDLRDRSRRLHLTDSDVADADTLDVVALPIERVRS